MKFTDRFIDSLKPEGKIIDIREGNGFGIRVLPSGVKTFFFIYRFDGKRRFLNLGHYDQAAASGERGTLAHARKLYTAKKKLVDDGMDPLTEQEQAKQEQILAPTVAKLVEEYITRHAKRFKRSWEKDEAILNRDVIPAWGTRKAKDITRRDVNHVLESIIDRGAPIMANNCFAVIRKMFNYAVEKDIIQISPCIGIKPPSPKTARDRVLSTDEIKTLWDNLPGCAISGDLQRALKLILLTAQRPGEVAGMHTAEIDGAWWTIPADRAKNGKAHRVYLTETALSLITETIEATKRAREIPEDTQYDGYIFPTPHLKKVKPIGDTALAVAVGRNLAFPLTDSTGKPLYTKDGAPATENKLGLDHFTPHDLRRTAATFMSQMGEMDEVIDAVLNHSKQGIIKVYNQNRYDREKQQALESWERKLQQIITGKGKDNVVSIGTAKGKTKAAA